MRLRLALLTLASMLVGLILLDVARAAKADPPPQCSQAADSDTCIQGNGKTSPGGGAKAPHAGWPAITGVFWMVKTKHTSTFVGGDKNDELLGWHGNETISGGLGRDVIWGDWDPDQPNDQSDVLDGGDGADWIYASHGKNVIRGGAGNDQIWATYGHGSIDCGPGTKDVVRLKIDYPYTVKNCELRTRPGKAGTVKFTPKKPKKP